VQPTLDITLLVRKYFGCFLYNYKERAGFNLCHGIGQDKDQCWGAYLDGLREVGENGFDVDYSNYDGSVPQCAVDAFSAVVDNFYGQRWRSERASLVEAIVHSHVLVEDSIVRKDVGNCSGSPITDVFNSVTNWYVVLAAYVLSRRAAGLTATLAHFDDDVRALTYGDDVIVAARDEVLQYYNRDTFKQVAYHLGMTVTSANKTAEIIPFEPLVELTFLKSPFVECDGYVAAPLPLKVIHRELMWGKKVNRGDVLIFLNRRLMPP